MPDLVIQALTGIAMAYVALCLFAILFSDMLIFPAPKTATYIEREPGIFRLPLGENGEFAALFLENPESDKVILYSHGNAEDLGMIRTRLEMFVAQGYSVIAYDYPGYGISDQRPSENGAYQALNAVYNYLLIIREIDPQKIFLYGFSLGGGPSFELARHRTVGGLIVEATFTSTFRVLSKVKLLPFDKFDNLSKIKELHWPVLVIHGRHDQVVPFHHGVRLHEKIAVEKDCLWVDGAGHDNIIAVAGSSYWDTLSRFINGKNS